VGVALSSTNAWAVGYASNQGAVVMYFDGRVIRGYRARERAFARLAATPSPGTRQLIERLRR
jgi:hypothetical protein